MLYILLQNCNASGQMGYVYFSGLGFILKICLGCIVSSLCMCPRQDSHHCHVTLFQKENMFPKTYCKSFCPFNHSGSLFTRNFCSCMTAYVITHNSIKGLMHHPILIAHCLKSYRTKALVFFSSVTCTTLKETFKAQQSPMEFPILLYLLQGNYSCLHAKNDVYLN